MLFLDEFGKGWGIFLIGVLTLPVNIALQYFQLWDFSLVLITINVILIGIGCFIMFTKSDERPKYSSVKEDKN